MLDACEMVITLSDAIIAYGYWETGVEKFCGKPVEDPLVYILKQVAIWLLWNVEYNLVYRDQEMAKWG